MVYGAGLLRLFFGKENPGKEIATNLLGASLARVQKGLFFLQKKENPWEKKEL